MSLALNVVVNKDRDFVGINLLYCSMADWNG